MCVPSATGENYCPNTAKEVRRRKGEASVRRRGMYGIPVAHNLKTRRVILHVLRPRRCLPNAAPHTRPARTPAAATTGSNGSHPLNLNRTTDRFRFVNLILPVNPLSEPRKIRLFLRSAYYHGYAHPSHIRCGLTYWAQTMTWTFLKRIPMLPPPLVLSGRGLCCRERSHLRHRAKIRSLPHVQSTQPRDQQHATSPEDFADDDEDNVLEVIIQDSMHAPRHLL